MGLHIRRSVCGAGKSSLEWTESLDSCKKQTRRPTKVWTQGRTGDSVTAHLLLEGRGRCPLWKGAKVEVEELASSGRWLEIPAPRLLPPSSMKAPTHQSGSLRCSYERS